jgi:vancomycin permeability regulator SanA
MRPIKILTILFLLTAAVVGGANVAYWLGERMDDNPAGTGSCAVLVLGYPTRADGSPDPVQRFRMSAGVEIYRQNHCGALVISGGAAHNQYVEAQTMAELARGAGVPQEHIVIEGKARSTWQNVGYATPLVAAYDRILIVSESLHAFRAKRYACRQDVNLCKRVRAVGRVGPASLWWWRIPASVYELLDYVRDQLIYERHEERNAPVCPAA